MIAYRYVNIPEHLTASGALVSKNEVRPAFFVRPREARIIAVHESTRLTIAKIQKIVADYYSIPHEEMRSDSRVRGHAWPRQMAMLLCKDLLDSSLSQMGRCFCRDHTTVRHALFSTRERIKSDSKSEAAYFTLKAMLSA